MKQKFKQQFQTMKELAKIQKEYFHVDMEEFREKLYYIEIKLLRLEKEVSIFRAKEEELDGSMTRIYWE